MHFQGFTIQIPGVKIPGSKANGQSENGEFSWSVAGLNTRQF
jgi:hypothetical protein